MNSQELQTQLQTLFGLEMVVKRPQLMQVSTQLAQLELVLGWLHHQAGFETLSTITCTDWLEEGIFHINYILQSTQHRLTLMVGFDIPRDGVSIPSWSRVWPQAETYERELKEMYGIEITGHPDMRDFMLENWNFMPPMRRDFDTKAFVDDFYVMRVGREDALDVKEVLKLKVAAKKAMEAPQEAKPNE